MRLIAVSEYIMLVVYETQDTTAILSYQELWYGRIISFFPLG